MESDYCQKQLNLKQIEAIKAKDYEEEERRET